MIRGLEIGVVGMREGGVRRVVIPPAVSYQDKTQEPVPRDFSNRQRLYDHLQPDQDRQRRGRHAEHGGVRHRARAGREAGVRRGLSMPAHDSNRHGDVSVTYGARVPVVASTKKKITSARRTIVFKNRNRAYVEPERASGDLYARFRGLLHFVRFV